MTIWKSVSVVAFLITCQLAASPSAHAQAKTPPAKNQKDAKADSDSKKSPTGTPLSKSAAKDGVQDLVLPTPDGWQIHCTYYESPAGRESACVIMLNSTDGVVAKDTRNRRFFQPTAVALQKAGFAVITADLRKHGDSVPMSPTGEPLPVKIGPADYALMASGDLESIKAFLMEQHRTEKLNIRKLSIVAFGSSCMVAAAFTVEDWAKTPYPDAPTLDQRTPRGQDVRALVMYSPNASVKGINTAGILKTVKGLAVPIYVVAGGANKTDKADAEKVFKGIELKGEQFKESRKMLLTSTPTHAEAFLEGSLAATTQKDIIDFLTKNAKDLELPWRDRTDRRSK
ncbi:MAG: alpha/beta hydrolase [Planctomyces sp.]